MNNLVFITGNAGKAKVCDIYKIEKYAI